MRGTGGTPESGGNIKRGYARESGGQAQGR